MSMRAARRATRAGRCLVRLAHAARSPGRPAGREAPSHHATHERGGLLRLVHARGPGPSPVYEPPLARPARLWFTRAGSRAAAGCGVRDDSRVVWVCDRVALAAGGLTRAPWGIYFLPTRPDSSNPPTWDARSGWTPDQKAGLGLCSCNAVRAVARVANLWTPRATASWCVLSRVSPIEDSRDAGVVRIARDSFERVRERYQHDHLLGQIDSSVIDAMIRGAWHGQ